MNAALKLMENRRIFTGLPCRKLVQGIKLRTVSNEGGKKQCVIFIFVESLV